MSVAATSWNQEAHVVYWDQPLGAWRCADNEGPVATALKKDNMADCSDKYAEIIRLGGKRAAPGSARPRSSGKG